MALCCRRVNFSEASHSDGDSQCTHSVLTVCSQDRQRLHTHAALCSYCLPVHLPRLFNFNVLVRSPAVLYGAMRAKMKIYRSSVRNSRITTESSRNEFLTDARARHTSADSCTSLPNRPNNSTAPPAAAQSCCSMLISPIRASSSTFQ